MRGFITSYEDANDRFEQSQEWNDQFGHIEIDIPQNTYTLLAMGDSHVGGTENLDRFFKDAREKAATAVVMVGDLTTGHKEDYDVFSEHLPLWDTLKYFAVAGNHDLYFDGWKHFYSMFGTSTYFFVINTPSESDLFICLESGGGTLGNLQLAWLKELLETSRNKYRYCTVLSHNNLFRMRPTTSGNPMVEEIQVLVDLFTRYKVNMVVTAHDHKKNTDKLGITTHIIMDSLQDDNDEASYLVISVMQDRMDYNFVKL